MPVGLLFLRYVHFGRLLLALTTHVEVGVLA